MSVVKVITKSRGTSGSADASGRYRYGISLQVITDDPADEAQTVGEALGTSPFDYYSFGNGNDPLARAKSIELRRSTVSPFVWDVEIEYDTTVEDWDENPLNRPTVIDYSSVHFQEPYWQDAVTGQPVVNSAKIYFDPPLVRDQSRRIITFTKNELTFPALADVYQDSVNSDLWFGKAIGTCKINIDGRFMKEGGYSFYENVYTVEYRRDGWTQSALNQGLTQIASGKQCPCTVDTSSTDSTQVNATEPQPLDASGAQLSKPYNAASMTYSTYNPYPWLPFAALGLP